MSTVEKYCSKLFPNVAWTGGSSIHVSFYRSSSMKDMGDDEALKTLYYGQVGRTIWSLLQDKFGACEFILSRTEFVNLFLVDAVRHLKGQGDSYSPKKLKNPNTGNVFHRIAFLEDIMGGIRFWCDRHHGGIEVGFRFRIEKKKDEETQRLKTRQVVDAAQIEVQEIIKQIEIAEPPSSLERQKITERIPVIE